MISVIIPIGARTEYLIECLESIQRQSYNELEIICVFDGVNKRSIVEDFEQLDKRILMADISQEGPGAARNTGLYYAKGEYVFFCDSDDILLPHAFNLLLEKMLTPNESIDVVVGSFIEQFDNGSATLCSVTSEGNDFEKFFSYFSIWNRLYRTIFLRDNKIKFQKRSQGEDMLFLADIFLNNPRVAVISNAVYQWQRHDTDDKETLTHSKSLDAFLELLDSWEIFVEKLMCSHKDEVLQYAQAARPYLLYRMENIKIPFQKKAARKKLDMFLKKLNWYGRAHCG